MLAYNLRVLVYRSVAVEVEVALVGTTIPSGKYVYVINSNASCYCTTLQSAHTKMGAVLSHHIALI
jgi:hypothetical protein